jgi:FixJ family two-component response regulator
MSAPTVFIVDDDASVRVALTRLLKGAGLSVKAFASAEEFLEAADEISVGCLVLDARLTGMSGPELQARLSDLAPRMPVVVITAVGDEQIEIDSLRAGATAFLRKPFEPRALLEAIARGLNGVHNGVQEHQSDT